MARFAVESHKLYCNGCKQVFLHFGADDFPLKISFEKCFKIVVFPLGRHLGVGIRFWSCNLCIAVARSSFVFCNSVSADRSGMAASRFLAAAAACAKLLCFAAASRKL